MSVFRRFCPKQTTEETSSDLLNERLALASDSWDVPRRRLEQSVGKLELDSSAVEVIKSKGKLIDQMGFAWRKKKYLHIEEALFLIDQGYLLLFQTSEDRTELLSLQDVYSLLDQCGISLDLYAIYADLKANGYVVFRHPLRWTLMQNENPNDLWMDWKGNCSAKEARVIYGIYDAPSKFKRKSNSTADKYIALIPKQRLSFEDIKALESQINGPVLCAFHSNGEIIYYSLDLKLQ